MAGRAVGGVVDAAALHAHARVAASRLFGLFHDDVSVRVRDCGGGCGGGGGCVDGDGDDDGGLGGLVGLRGVVLGGGGVCVFYLIWIRLVEQGRRTIRERETLNCFHGFILRVKELYCAKALRSIASALLSHAGERTQNAERESLHGRANGFVFFRGR